MHYRLKTNFQGQENIFPNKFPTRQAAEDELAMHVPAPMIRQLLDQKVVEIYPESEILGSDGKPMTWDDGKAVL